MWKLHFLNEKDFYIFSPYPLLKHFGEENKPTDFITQNRDLA